MSNITTLRIPKAAVSTQEGTVSVWLVADGQSVKEGQPLYTLEIEKSTLDIDSPATGTLRHLVSAGTTLRVGQPIGEIVSKR